MLISTRGRYALRVMIDLAENSDGCYVAMKEVAARQQISLKYLERILPLLVEAKLVEGVRGKGGGYRLTQHRHDAKLHRSLRDVIADYLDSRAARVIARKMAPHAVRDNDQRPLALIGYAAAVLIAVPAALVSEGQIATVRVKDSLETWKAKIVSVNKVPARLTLSPLIQFFGGPIPAYAPETGSKEYQSILPLYSVELAFLDDNLALPDFGRVASVTFTHSARLYDKVRQFAIAAFRKEM